MGAALGAAGCDVLSGGHEGVMAAVSEGARSAGARVLGVSCGPIRAARGAAVNAFLHELIDAPTLLTRIEILMRRAAGYVFFPGGAGTLAELSVVWEHVARGLIAPRPLVFPEHVWEDVLRHLEREAPCACVHRAETVARAAELVVQHAVTLPEAERSYSAGKDIVRVNG